MTSFRYSLLALTGALCLATAAVAQSLAQYEAEFVKVVAKVRPGVVQVSGELAGREVSWSGVILDDKGHIASAGSMVRLVEQMRVRFHGGKTLIAKRVGFDPVTSLGVIKVDPAAATSAGIALTPLAHGDPATLKVGSMAIVVGNPFGLTGSISTGIISGKDRAIQSGASLLTGMLQTTAPINPGDAGGLLADREGRMIGIITSTFGRGMSVEEVSHAMRRMLSSKEFQRQMMAFSELMARLSNPQDLSSYMQKMIQKLKEMEDQGKGPGAGLPSGSPHPGFGLSAEGINFVLPLDQVRRITGDLIAHGHVRRGFLGLKVQMMRDAGSEAADAWRMIVEEVVAGGPAEAAGLKVGDVLVSADGRRLSGVIDLKGRLVRLSPGDELTLRVRRGARELALVVTLGGN